MDVDKKVPYGSPRSRRVNQVKTSRNASGAMIQQDTPTAFSNAPPRTRQPRQSAPGRARRGQQRYRHTVGTN